MFPDAFVEKISFMDVEDSAERLLQDYEDENGQLTYPTPVESIAEHFLGYDLEITDQGLFADPNFLGGISFETSTIFVNASVEAHEGRYTFTIAHEIGHHVLHKAIYEELIDDRTQILCREQKKKPLIERQADRFAAALMMPRRALADAECLKKLKRPTRSLPQAMKLAGKVQAECGFSNVSLSAMVNRLKDLELIGNNIPYQTGVKWKMGRRASIRYLIESRLRRLFRL